MYPTKEKSMIGITLIILSILHAALHAESCCNCSQDGCKRLKNEFPSFFSHSFLSLEISVKPLPLGGEGGGPLFRDHRLHLRHRLRFHHLKLER